MNTFTDIGCLIVIIIFIRMMYKTSYEKEANEYMKNQFGIIGSSSISSILILNIYYFFENKYHIDGMYTNGILLILAFLIGGLLCEWIYKHYFYCENSKYSPTNEEYLFTASMSFISVSIKMISEGTIGITIPVALLLGRFIWLDTRTIRSIKESIEVRHIRLIESSVLVFVGMVLLSFFSWVLSIPTYVEVLIACGYGIMVCLPYKCVRDRLTHNNNNK